VRKAVDFIIDNTNGSMKVVPIHLRLVLCWPKHVLKSRYPVEKWNRGRKSAPLDKIQLESGAWHLTSERATTRGPHVLRCQAPTPDLTVPMFSRLMLEVYYRYPSQPKPTPEGSRMFGF
jgi:hypothetical protein